MFVVFAVFVVFEVFAVFVVFAVVSVVEGPLSTCAAGRADEDVLARSCEHGRQGPHSTVVKALGFFGAVWVTPVARHEGLT